MIENGELAATRAESGRREWTVRREDALTAGLRLPADDEPIVGTVLRGSISAVGVDAALRDLLEELLRPIESRLVRIESQTTRVSMTIDDLADSRRSRPHAWRQILMRICGRFLDVTRRRLR